MGSPGGGVDSSGAGGGGGPSGNDGPSGSDRGSDRPDDNDRGGSRDDKDSFDRAMDNANRPDRAPAASPDTSTAPDDGDDDRPSTDKPDDRPDRAAGPPGVGAPPSAPSPADTPATTDDEDEDQGGGLLDSVGDFFGGLADDIQDFARDNPRVDSHGNPVGLVDSDGIQRGEVASRVRSSGTSSEDLAAQLGFSSPEDMSAAQTTDFIEAKYSEDKAAEMVAALEDRYGPVPPGMQIVLASSTLPITDRMSAIALDDAAKVGARNVTRALGPIGFLVNLGIDIMSPTPVADGTVKSEQASQEAQTESDDKVDGVLDGAEPSTPAKQGKTRQYEKPGGLDQANEDFDGMGLDGVRTFPDSQGKPAREGVLPDGRKVRVRETSREGSVTIDIDAKPGEKTTTKIRYGE